MRSYLDFEKPVAELEAKAEELRAMQAGDDAANIAEELARLQTEAAQALRDLYSELTPWQKTPSARQTYRSHCLAYITGSSPEFMAFAGYRTCAADEAIVGGFGRI